MQTASGSGRPRELLPLTEGFGRRVLVLGDLVADHYIYGQSDRVSREAPVLVVRYESAEVKLGGAANAAANAAELGGKITAVGVLGDDEMGRAMRDRFSAAGIVVRSVSGAGVETETKTRILAGGVNTTRQQMLRLDRGGRGMLPPGVRAELAELLAAEARGCDAVIVSDYGGGVVCGETIAVLRRLAAEGLLVCADSRYQLRNLTGMTVAKPNLPELEALSGLLIRTPDDLLAAGRKAGEMLGCQALLVTRGREGMVVFDTREGLIDSIPVFGAHEAVDVTGAGDTVLAAFALAMAAGARASEAARVANVAGALVVQKQGTATVSLAELQAALDSAEHW